ncbi:MAG TPA: hypothetical protein VGM23_03720, partial [Armatimonadota bacterium]
MPVQKHICILSFSPVARDARVLRQIKYLAPHYRLTVIGQGERPNFTSAETVEWHAIETPTRSHLPHSSSLAGIVRYNIDKAVRLCREGRFWSVLAGRLLPILLSLQLGKLFHFLYDQWYWSIPLHQLAYERASSCECDLFLANDWNTLPLAVECAKKRQAHVVLDLHEYAPLEFEDIPAWRRLYTPAIIYFLKKYAPAIAASITIAAPIADRYRREFPLDPIVVHNVPEYSVFSSRLVDPEQVQLIHHGGAMRSRHLENMLQTLALCHPRFRLHLMLVGDQQGYVQELRTLAESLAPGRVFFHNPVPTTEIVRTIAE